VGPLSDPVNHFSRYHYAANNPYANVDPDGRASANVFRPEEKNGFLFRTGEAFNVPGVFTIARHGGPGFVQDQTMVVGGQYANLEAAALKSVLSSEFGLKPGQPVLSASCHFGATNASGENAAQQLARDNRSTGYGADGYVSYRPDGDNVHLEVFSGTNRSGVRGAFVEFDSSGARVPGAGIESITINAMTGDTTLRYAAVTGSRIGRIERIGGKKP
jgi:hypothetical protein